MKVRSDFVTNSSSSSFVIAYRDMPQVDEETLKKYPFISLFPKLIESIMNEDSDDETECAEIFSKKEDFDKYILDRCGWRNANIEDILSDDDYSSKTYEKAVKYLENGYRIAAKRVGYSDEGVANIIKTLANDNDDFVILEDNS